MKNLTALVCLLLLTCSVVTAQTTKTLNALGSFGFRGDGSARPGDFGFIDSNDMNQRGIAYDPISTYLVYVNAKSGSGGSNGVVMGTIEILDSNGGFEIGTLNTNGMGGGSYADIGVAVADDGAVYVCNQVNSSGTSPFKIYRWGSVTSTDPPVLAFNSTILPAQRYGESIDIRGSGANTQIIIGSMPGSSGTNVVIFTTADGTNFTAKVLATDATSANFNDGIAFGVGDTFWAKRIGAPLRYMSFNLGSLTATTLATYSSTNMPNVGNLGPIAVDTANNLLAAIELVGGTVTAAPERVWLFDISDPMRVPSSLGYRDFVPNFQNATAPLGYLDFGGGKLYAAVTRNGILASSVDSGPMPAPIFSKDLPLTNRVAIAQTAHFEVEAYPNITGYQWSSNGVPLVGQTNYFLDVPNVQTNDTGKIFSVLVSNAAGSTPSANSMLYVVNPEDLFHLNRLWSAAPGASPGPTNWYTGTGAGTPTERTIAYNSLSNQLYVVYRNGNAVKISVVDPETGNLLYNLRTNGIIFNANINIPLCGIGVAEDGAIYACNSVVAASINEFRIYRWADADPNTTNTVIFQGNPAVDNTGTGYRWGDVMDVRGSGANTELLFDAQNETRYVSVVVPNGDMTANWRPKSYLLQNVPTGPGGGAGGTGIGRSIQFGEGNVFWQKRWAAGGSPLCESGYEPSGSGSLAPLVLASTAQPLYTNGPVGINFALKLGAAVNFANAGNASGVPDKLDLYDMTSPSSPVLLNRYNFPVNALANGNRIAQVIFTTNYVFAIDANNGVLGYKVAAGPIPPPVFLTQPKSMRIIEGGSGTLTVAVDQTATIQWVKDGSNVGTGLTTYTISNAQTNVAGFYWAVATSANGVITSQVARVTIGLTNDNYRLSQAWTAVPGVAPYVSSNGGANTPNERCFAYHSASNQLIFTRCAVGTASIPTVYVVDANNGTSLYTMHTEGYNASVSDVSGSNPINMLGVAVSDDGSVYACNGTPNASGGNDGSVLKMLHVYRWANSGPDTFLSDVFMGDPSGQAVGVNVRWGDNLTVRGGGTNTEILMDSNDGLYGSVLRPVDASITNFTSDWFGASAAAGSIGRSLQFGQTNSLWQKRKGGKLYLSSYNTNSHSSTALTNLDFSSTLGGLAVDMTKKIAVGVDFVGNTTTPDAVALYDISDISTPMLIARYNFPAPQPGNANAICHTVITANKVYSLDGNAGFVALNILPPLNSAPPVLNITRSGGNVNLSWSDSSAILQSATSLTTPISWGDISTAGQTNVTQSATGAAKFYRLRK